MSAVLTERDGHVLIITLNRPEALNAVNAALATELGEALEELARDPDLRVGVIRAAGRAFCAGMDLKAFASGESVDAVGHAEWGFAGIAKHFIDKPLIAAVSGAAVGGGLEIALACDLIVAGENARFGLPEVTRGLFAAGGGLLRLSRVIGEKAALRLALTGEIIDADAAIDLSLALPGDALALAHQIAANAPLAVQTTKRLAYAAATTSPWNADAWLANDDEMSHVFSSADAAEGSRAFAEKRTPNWRSK